MGNNSSSAEQTDQDPKETINAGFAGAAMVPDAWLARATSLIDFAEVLAADFLNRVHTKTMPPNQWEVGALSTLNLWTGCAIENAFKAVLVKESRIYVEDGELKGYITHNLVALARAASFQAIGETLAQLERLTEVVVWESRYAFPLHAESWAKAKINHPSSTDVTTPLKLAKEVRDWAATILAVDGPMFKIGERLS